MRICFTINGRTYCFTVPIIAYPIHPPKPDPEHKDYEGLISDATILGSIRAAANQLSDAAAKETLRQPQPGSGGSSKAGRLARCAVVRELGSVAWKSLLSGVL